MKLSCPTPLLKKVTTLIGVLSVGALLSTQVLFAQEFSPTDDTITLTAIPPRVGDLEPLRIAPGEKEQVQLRVRNNSSTAITVRSVAQDFILDLDGETPIPLTLTEDTNSRWSLADWLVIAPNQQTIQPQQTVAVSVLIEVPEDALPGGHYAMVTHEPVVPLAQQTGGSASAISQKVGSLFYLIVDGPVREEAFIRDLDFPRFTETGPVEFSLFVDNQSDVHIKPIISVDIYNIFNQKVDTIVLEGKNVFPLFSRGFEGQWDRVWGYGYYTAKVSMSYGSQGNIALAHTSFWLFPLKIVLAILVLLLTITAGGVSIRRHMLHRKDTKDQQIKELEEKLAQMNKQNLKQHEE